MLAGQSLQTDNAGLAGVGRLPSFELPSAEGTSVRSWGYRGRQHLVVWLAGATPSPPTLQTLAAHLPEVRAEGAELLLLVQASPEAVAALAREHELRNPVLADADGRVHQVVAATVPTVLVADRAGTIYWHASAVDADAAIREAVSWLAYLNIREPECGTCVPAWPTDV